MKDGKHVILYVDDDQDMLNSVRIVLESSGYLMVEAKSGEEGLKACRETKPDFIFVDLMMESLDSGIAFVKETSRAGVAAPVYLLSALGDQFDSLANPIQFGISGVFQKPIDFQAMLKTIRIHLNAPYAHQ